MLTAAAVVVQISPARASWPLFIRKRNNLYLSFLRALCKHAQNRTDSVMLCVCVWPILLLSQSNGDRVLTSTTSLLAFRWAWAQNSLELGQTY